MHEATPTLGTPSPFVGLENYREVLQQPSVGDSTVQTIFYVLTALVLEIGLGLAIAVLLHRTFRGRGLVLAILILPWALPSVVSGVLWRRIFDPDTGLLNSFLVQTGIIDQPHVWLADQGWATLFITLVHVWGVLPLVTLVFIAGLQAIPDEVYSASAVDGASPWRQFRHITLPLLRPSLVVALVVGTVNAINIFDEIYVLNGTALNTRSILMEVYTTTFANGEFAAGDRARVHGRAGDRDPGRVLRARPAPEDGVRPSRPALTRARDRDRAAGRLVARAGAGRRDDQPRDAEGGPAGARPLGSLGPEHRVLLGPARRRGDQQRRHQRRRLRRERVPARASQHDPAHRGLDRSSCC